jgi:hypothetical protein
MEGEVGLGQGRSLDTGHCTYIPQPVNACEATHLLNSDVFPADEIVAHHGHHDYHLCRPVDRVELWLPLNTPASLDCRNYVIYGRTECGTPRSIRCA